MGQIAKTYLDANGGIVVPAFVRKELMIENGDLITFQKTEDGNIQSL
jgi:AbrB family looped-hinge helix DNA binding protein